MSISSFATKGIGAVVVDLESDGVTCAGTHVKMGLRGTSEAELAFDDVRIEPDDLLDSHDTVEGAYTLEVSSPGINRPLTRPEHFARFVGKRIRVRTRDMIDNRRSFLGILEEVLRDEIMLTQEGKAYQIPFTMIEKSNYEHDWSA